MKNYSGVLFRGIRQLRNNDLRLFFIILVVVVAGTVIPRRVGIILTPSLAHRFFWVSKEPEHVGRGDYVCFEDAELARAVGKPEHPNIFKIIRCDEGDTLTVDVQKQFSCNGEFLGVAKDYSLKGEKMPFFVFNGKIPPGFMFVMGEHKDSYDSRYFGLKEKNRIRAKLYPIF